MNIKEMFQSALVQAVFMRSIMPRVIYLITSIFLEIYYIRKEVLSQIQSAASGLGGGQYEFYYTYSNHYR